MKLKALFFFIVFTAAGGLKASKIETAFEALSIYNYFEAKKDFYSLLGKRPKAAACYGLAVIFYRHDNPFHNTDSASKYITLSGNYFHQNPLKESYFGFIIDSSSISSLADSIATLNFTKARRLATLPYCEYLMTTDLYASPQLRFNLGYLRDEIAYKANLALNSSDSTLGQVLRYPESYFLNDYLLLFDKQQFEEQTKLKSIEQYVSFIKRFPANRFVPQAQDELFEIYRRNSTIAELDFYVRSYPNSQMVNEAWKLLYSLSVKSYSAEELRAFVERYPDFPFKASINKEIELSKKQLIPVNDSDYTGFVDTAGNYAIPPVYEAATPFREGLAVVERNDSAWFINKENENVFSAFFKDAYPFSNGFAPVNIGEQWFLINRQGQKASGPYEELSEQSEGIYIFKQSGKYGAIDAYGNVIIQPRYDKMGDFRNGMAYYTLGNLYGFVNALGVSSRARYQWVSDFDENRIAMVKLNNFYGLVDQNDSLLLTGQNDLVVKAKNNVFIVVRNGKYGFYSGAGCFLSEVEFDFRKELSADFYTNGRLFRLIKGGKTPRQALMDANGRLTIDYGTFEEVNFAQENLIRVRRQGKYGFADRRLNLVIPCKYTTATDFDDSLSICTIKQRSLLINTRGDEVLKTNGSIQNIARGYYLVKEEEGDFILAGSGRLRYGPVDSWQISPVGYLIITFENKSRKVIRL